MRESTEVGSVEKGITPSKVPSLKQLSARALAFKHFREIMEEAMQPSSGVDTPISRALSFFRSFPEIKSRGYGIDKFVTQLVMEMHQDVAKELYHACMQIEGITESKPGSLSDEIKQQLKLIFEQYTGHEYPDDFLEMIFEVFLKRYQLIEKVKEFFTREKIDKNKLAQFVESIPAYGYLEVSEYLQNALLLAVESLSALKLALQQDPNNAVGLEGYNRRVEILFEAACYHDFAKPFQALCAMTDDNPELQLDVLRHRFRVGVLVETAVVWGSKSCLSLLIELSEKLSTIYPELVCEFHYQLRNIVHKAQLERKDDCLSLLLKACVTQARALQDSEHAGLWDLSLRSNLFGDRGAIPLMDLFTKVYVEEAEWHEDGDDDAIKRCIDQFLQENLSNETDIQLFVESVRQRARRRRISPKHTSKIICELQETLSAPQDSDDLATTHFSPGAKL